MGMVSNGMIPVLDFDSLTRAPHSRKSARTLELYRSNLSQFGFEKIRNIGISPRLIQAAYRQLRLFFSLTSEVKRKYHKKTQFGDRMGYIPPRTEVARGADKANLMEMFQFGNPDYGFNIWPPKTLLPLFRKTMEALYQEAIDIAGPSLLQATEKSFGYPAGLLSQMLTNGNTSIRLIRYAPLDVLHAQDDEPLAEQHEDINLKTILLPNAVDGPDTQIRLPDSSMLWYSLGNEPGVFIINSGDMLKLFSTRYYEAPLDMGRELDVLLPHLLDSAVIPSTTHRVARPVDRRKASYRIAIFLHPRPDIVLAHGITAGDFLKFRMAENYSKK